MLNNWGCSSSWIHYCHCTKCDPRTLPWNEWWEKCCCTLIDSRRHRRCHTNCRHIDTFGIVDCPNEQNKEQAEQKGVLLEAAVYDLAHPYFPPNSFDVIVNFRFLERSTFAAYRQALKPGGWLIFETFLQMDKRVAHPDYYLQPGELQDAFANFEIAAPLVLRKALCHPPTIYIH